MRIKLARSATRSGTKKELARALNVTVPSIITWEKKNKAPREKEVRDGIKALCLSGPSAISDSSSIMGLCSSVDANYDALNKPLLLRDKVSISCAEHIIALRLADQLAMEKVNGIYICDFTSVFNTYPVKEVINVSPVSCPEVRLQVEIYHEAAGIIYYLHLTSFYKSDILSMHICPATDRGILKIAQLIRKTLNKNYNNNVGKN